MFTWLQMKMLVRLGSKPGRAPYLEFDAGETQDIAKEDALRPVVFARIDEDAESNQKRADHGEMDSADGPQHAPSER